jgi:exodeoxyribonuclease X
MIIRTVDLETTGLEPTDAIVEAGWTDVECDMGGNVAMVGPTMSYLVNPGRPIPPQASAIHHITDRDVEHAEPAADVLTRMGDGADIFASFGADFDRMFFGGGDKRWICIRKASIWSFRDCPAHSNQCLRYWLKLDLAGQPVMPPHRAGPDSCVSAHILARLLETVPIETLTGWTDKPVLLIRCGFGKHIGTPWSDVPTGYLEWILKQDFDRDTMFTARHFLKVHGRR